MGGVFSGGNGMNEQIDVAALQARVAELEAREAAIYAAMDEWGTWPDLPGVPYAARLVNPETMEFETLMLRPQQIEGLAAAIAAHIQTLVPFGKTMSDWYHRSALLRLWVERETQQRAGKD